VAPSTHRLGPRFHAALAWADELHAAEVRKGPGAVSFTSHLLAVAALVLEDGGDEVDAVIAVCHDAAEEHGEVALTEIRRRFGATVADVVAQLSDSVGPPVDSFTSRKTRLLGQLTHPDLDPRALRVAAADKLHNVRSLLVRLRHEGPEAWSAMPAPAAEVVWFYDAVGALLADRLPDSANAAELVLAAAELAAWVPEGRLSPTT
jgi:(p)ppGpp synthase/HD superfamily hydrolase